jgi:hypothetical protein
VLRKVLHYTWVVVAIAALYVGYTFLARHDENSKLARRSAEQDAEHAREEVDRLGGESLKILQFYAPPLIAKGQKAQLCYGVANARTVTIEPEVDRTWPALTRCLEIAPTKDTVYKLTAKDAAGHSVEQQIVVQVK